MICKTCGRNKEEGEKCGCEIDVVYRLELPTMNEGGGINSWMKGRKYPYPGIVSGFAVALNDMLKRNLIKTLKLFPFIILFADRFMEWASCQSEVVFRQLKKFVIIELTTAVHLEQKIIEDIFSDYGLNSHRWCRSGRELQRVLTLEGLDGRLINGILMMWEFDNAYRFRGQDILNELIKWNLNRNPRKEIIRLLKLGLKRDSVLRGGENSLDKKWKLLILLVNLLFTFKRKYAKMLVDILDNLDLDEIKPSQGDWYFMCERWDYDFGGIRYKERIAIKLKEDEDFIEEEEKPLPAAVGIQGNYTFKTLSTEKAYKLLNMAVENYMRDNWPKVRIQ